MTRQKEVESPERKELDYETGLEIIEHVRPK